jgi:hypothetical protein
MSLFIIDPALSYIKPSAHLNSLAQIIAIVPGKKTRGIPQKLCFTILSFCGNLLS